MQWTKPETALPFVKNYMKPAGFEMCCTCTYQHRMRQDFDSII